MTLVLDTSILIDIEQRKQATINKLRELSLLHPLPAKITFINEFEFLYGLKEKSPANKAQALALLYKFGILHTTEITAGLLAELKSKYEKKGLAFPLADLLIATLVVENNMTFVTRDKDFEQIEELKKVVL